MELRDHLIGPCARVVGEDEIDVDIGALVRRLVLFERYTLRTIRLREIGALVHAFGEGGLRELLADGCLRIYCDALQMGQAGALAPGGPLPDDQYFFAAIRPHDHKQYVSGCLQEIHRVDGLTQKQAQRLKLAVVDALAPVAQTRGARANNQLDTDLDTSSPVLAAGVALAAGVERGVPVDPAAVKLDINRLSEHAVEVRSNLPALLGVDDLEARRLVERGLLAVGGLNIRLELMEQLDGISGCEPQELSLFEGKLAFLLRDADPDAQEERFLRVQQLAELPDPDLTGSPAIDAEALLRARTEPEARALRAWLRGADRLADEEIVESFSKVREALGRAMRSTGGKSARIAVTTGIGFVPVVGPVAGVVAGALDGFLLDRVLPEPGPYSFLSHTWPSLFTGS